MKIKDSNNKKLIIINKKKSTHNYVPNTVIKMNKLGQEKKGG